MPDPTDQTVHTIYPPCDHPYTQAYTTGQITFSRGEVLDTVQTHVVCLACGQELPEEFAPQEP